MSYVEENVSVDPGPNAVPISAPPKAVHGHVVRQSPIVGGLAATADDPATAEPLDHPQSLLGERPTLGSDEMPG